jgi:hypothetical protein
MALLGNTSNFLQHGLLVPVGKKNDVQYVLGVGVHYLYSTRSTVVSNHKRDRVKEVKKKQSLSSK